MFRLDRLAIAFGLALLACAGRANCTLDGAAVLTQLSASASPATSAFTNSLSNSIIVIISSAYKFNSPGPHLISITGGGLSFTNRTPTNGYNSDNIFGTTWFGIQEIWWALASSAVSSQQFTLNFDAAVSGQSLASVLAVNGVVNTALPWDANGSIPKHAADLSGSSTIAQVTGVSTTTPADFLLSYCTNWSATASCPGGADPSGWVRAVAGTSSTAGVGTWYKTVSTPQGSVTIPASGASMADWSSIADALACGPGGNVVQFHAPW